MAKLTLDSRIHSRKAFRDRRPEIYSEIQATPSKGIRPDRENDASHTISVVAVKSTTSGATGAPDLEAGVRHLRRETSAVKPRSAVSNVRSSWIRRPPAN